MLGLFLVCFSLSFSSCHTNKRAGMVKGLKLNKLCPTALNTQTGCSKNIKKPQTPKERGGRAWQNNRSDLVGVTVHRLLQWAYTQASNVRKTALEGLGYTSFCCLYRKCSQHFKEFSKPTHRPVQPTSQTRWFRQFCVNTGSRYHLQIKREYERSLPGHATKLGWVSLLSATLLAVEAPGAALFLCRVLIVTERWLR